MVETVEVLGIAARDRVRVAGSATRLAMLEVERSNDFDGAISQFTAVRSSMHKRLGVGFWFRNEMEFVDIVAGEGRRSFRTIPSSYRLALSLQGD